ncbi:uncharacterized protein LOC132309936 [Cornus florida]|uniref:uncharacterized protein LOC132309936 n=1 Tax=Cornus florida TaxID=4283 RepID=UPI00289FA204|nr:uncharacterized protein LOC132309936 [Cornus florida]
MAQEKQKANSIYEARDDEMVSVKDGKSRVRIARFLRPCTRHVRQAVGIPHTPLLSEIFSHDLQQWPSQVLFKGWKQPQKKWKEWVDRLAPKHGAIWNQTGICDAIMASIYEMRCNQDLLLGLSEFWCSKTNTFVFPWGEATITLEDVMIIGGYPVLGKPVNSPLSGGLVKIEEAMNKHRIELCRSKAKKATHGGWLSKFMEVETEYEFEHVAFLSLWLSRYVFPSLPEETIGKHVFPIAAQLSQGVQLALAPAVLASLYQNLTMLKEKAMVSAESIIVSGPLPLLQLWAFERFPLVGPNLDEELQSFFRCLQVSELVGIGCKEKYMPHRVGMQFGMDQDLPCDGSSSVFTSSSRENVFFVPPRNFEPGVSVRYFNWWKDSMCARKDAVHGVIAQKRIMKSKSLLSAQTKMKKKDLGASVESKSLKRCNTISRFSGKSGDKGSLKTAASRITTKSKTSPSVGAKNCKDDSHAAVSSRTQKSPEELFRVSSKSNVEESHASVTPSSNIYQDSSDDDNILLADRLARKANSCKLFPRVVNENRRKRKFLSTTEENPQGKATIGLVKVAKKLERKDDDSMNGPKGVATDVKRKADQSANGLLGVARKVERKADDSANIPKGVDRDVKRVASDSANDPLDFVVLSKRMEQNKSCRESVKDVAKEGEGKKFKKAGESSDNPINIDGCVRISTSRVQKRPPDLEERVQILQKLEELLGVERY